MRVDPRIEEKLLALFLHHCLVILVTDDPLAFKQHQRHRLECFGFVCFLDANENRGEVAADLFTTEIDLLGKNCSHFFKVRSQVFKLLRLQRINCGSVNR